MLSDEEKRTIATMVVEEMDARRRKRMEEAPPPQEPPLAPERRKSREGTERSPASCAPATVGLLQIWFGMKNVATLHPEMWGGDERPEARRIEGSRSTTGGPRVVKETVN